MESFTATLSIDPAPRGKKFQGVWLDRGDERWVIDYRARELWTPFDRLTVEVTGSRYTPVGQAIDALHFRVETLAVSVPADTRRFRRIGPEHALTGMFGTSRGSAGSKSEGMEQRWFESGGQRFEVVGGDAAPAGAATVIARTIEVNPAWAATTGGPHLWIVSATPR